MIDSSLDTHLYNPLSGSRIQLPSLTTSDPDEWRIRRFSCSFVDKAFLSCEPAPYLLSQTYVLMLFNGNLIFCKVGDEVWTEILKYDGEKAWHEGAGREYMDAVYYKEKFYIVDSPVRLTTVDINGNVDHPKVTLYDKTPGESRMGGLLHYLVESNGELFQLKRHVELDDTGLSIYGTKGNDFEWTRYYRTTAFEVFKLRESEVGGLGWKKVDNIGNRAFFVGRSGSFSLSTVEYSGYKPNSIYFTQNNLNEMGWPEPVRHDIGVFKLEDQTMEHIYPVDSKPVKPTPFWYCSKTY